MSLVKLLLTGCLLAVPESVSAQRQPVLRQIRVPHSYYYREMYLPQVTSGPSSVTWSPDGQELIYSMHGSLWRYRLGRGEVRQLTAGPGYAYQPDWSPDGDRVVYAWYRDDAIGLHLLDLRNGKSTPLVANAAVNVDPRWSPDGRRIAYVSTAYEGRWHIFIAVIENGERLGPVERITEDRSGGLPRYYYGDHDQYLSPTWSPDAAELIFVGSTCESLDHCGRRTKLQP
jgi:TolB protein